MPDLSTPTLPSSIRDDHAWHFPDPNGQPTRARLQVWPTLDGGHLVITTDLELRASLITAAESTGLHAGARSWSTSPTTTTDLPCTG
ncbi:hypothetical protein ACFV19_27955 [Streptomyces griseoluteus]|uniref:hypothetical protein n=1 Tax=Streptomyces griseoluteus TaxID=29306 RepID=UPI0036A2A352